MAVDQQPGTEITGIEHFDQPITADHLAVVRLLDRIVGHRMMMTHKDVDAPLAVNQRLAKRGYRSCADPPVIIFRLCARPVAMKRCGIEQDDAHIFCTPEQVEDEVVACLEFAFDTLRAYGFEKFEAEISTWDGGASGKYDGTKDQWELAEGALRRVTERMGIKAPVIPDEAAFYGPKADFMVRDCIGREWQLGTVQLDYNLPERFQLEYIGADNKAHRPVMIHRALFGSIERFFGVLTEHYAGAFPPWLAPVQVRAIPVAEAFNGYLEEIVRQMRSAGIRAEVDISDDRMQKKIRNAQAEKIPFMIIAGEEDQKVGAISFRYRNGEQKNGVPIATAIAEITAAINNRAQV